MRREYTKAFKYTKNLTLYSLLQKAATKAFTNTLYNQKQP